jgi:nitrite reductase/ring-hydroxylating ferredoxin subunit
MADAGEWHRVAGADEVPEGAVRPVRAGNHVIALCRVGGRLGALAGTCPHAGGPLGEGTIENGRLVCPWHGREYDPVTGACEGYAESVAAYPAEARADGIYVCVDAAKG